MQAGGDGNIRKLLAESTSAKCQESRACGYERKKGVQYFESIHKSVRSLRPLR
jgi:hypothetical protein